MFLTEAHPDAVARIDSALFGLHDSGFRADSLLACRARVLRLLDSAMQLYHQRRRHDSSPENHTEGRWLIQESHSGQQRPIVSGAGVGSLIYKPRSVAADIAWGCLVAWYSEQVGEMVCHSVVHHPRNEYGWAEVVINSPLGDRNAERYYERLGLLAALTWTIGSNDFGASNVVAAGEFPAVVDAEMALVPGSVFFDQDALTEFRRCGIAPYKTVNLSGDEVSFSAAALRGVTCIHRQDKGEIGGGCWQCHHVPIGPDGSGIFIDGHHEVFCRGFSQGLRCLTSLRQKLLSDSSPLHNFAAAKGRVVFRPTSAYLQLQERLFFTLRSSGGFGSLYSLISAMPTKHSIVNNKDTLIESELFDLIQADVPRFELRMDARHLVHYCGFECDFAYSGVERAMGRLNALTASMTERVTSELTDFVSFAMRRERAA